LPGANTDFTIEAWVYLTATPGATEAQILGFGEYGLNSDYVFAINSSRQLYFYFSSSNTVCANTTTLVPLNAWTYVAVSRSGTGSNNLKVFVECSVDRCFKDETYKSKRGIIDNDYKLVLPFEYDWIDYTNGVWVVRKGRSEYILDKNYKLIPNSKFNKIGKFEEEGIACVQDENLKYKPFSSSDVATYPLTTCSSPSGPALVIVEF
jgi:hypothetical protein